MDNLLPQIAVWLLQRGYANDYEQAMRFATNLNDQQCSEEMVNELSKNLDIFMSLGQPVTAEKLLAFLTEKVQFATKLIKFWTENPKDTNAIFFFKECHKYGI